MQSMQLYLTDDLGGHQAVATDKAQTIDGNGRAGYQTLIGAPAPTAPNQFLSAALTASVPCALLIGKGLGANDA